MLSAMFPRLRPVTVDLLHWFETDFLRMRGREWSDHYIIPPLGTVRQHVFHFLFLVAVRG